jgi:CheY-like chemotaxis protein
MKPILLLEDSPDDVALLRRALNHARIGSPLQVVASVPDAIAYLQGTGSFAEREEFPLPELILADLKLPEMDGFAFLEWKREQPEFKEILTVVVSGDDDPLRVRRACALGASAFLHKSCLRLDLETLIRAFPQFRKPVSV